MPPDPPPQKLAPLALATPASSVLKVWLRPCNNTSLPPTKKTPARNVFTEDVVDYIESEKLCKPSIYTSEIQQRLLLDGVVPPHHFSHLPSQSGTKKCVRDDRHITKKKVTQVATESLSEANVHYTDYFLDRISQLDCTTLRF